MKREFLNFKITENSNGKGVCFTTEGIEALQITAEFKRQLELFPENLAQLIKIINDNPENISSLKVISLGGDKEISDFVIWFSQNFYGNFEIYDKQGFLDWEIINQEGGLTRLKSNTIEIERGYYEHDLFMKIDSSFSAEYIKKEAEIISKILKKLKQGGKDFPELREENGTIVFQSYDVDSKKVEVFFEIDEKGISETVACDGTIAYFSTGKEVALPKGYEVKEFPFIQLIKKDKVQAEIYDNRENKQKNAFNIEINVDSKIKEFGISSSNEFIDFQEENLPLIEELLKSLKETKIDKAAPKVMEIIETAIINYEAEIFSKNERKENFEKAALVFGESIEIDKIF
jgi:hypothetical protein